MYLEGNVLLSFKLSWTITYITMNPYKLESWIICPQYGDATCHEISVNSLTWY